VADNLPIFSVSAGSGHTYQTKVVSSDLGDGRQQRVADGLNNVRIVYTMVQEWLDQSEATTLRNFVMPKLSSGDDVATVVHTIGDGVTRTFQITSVSERRQETPWWSFTLELQETF
jgi:phage-related protein